MCHLILYVGDVLRGQEKPSDVPKATPTQQPSSDLYATQIHKLDFVFRRERSLLLEVFS